MAFFREVNYALINSNQYLGFIIVIKSIEKCKLPSGLVIGLTNSEIRITIWKGVVLEFYI